MIRKFLIAYVYIMAENYLFINDVFELIKKEFNFTDYRAK